MTKIHNRPVDSSERSFLMRAASYASMSVAISLVILKTWAWAATDSVSLLSSLADSALDIIASALTFWAVRFSLSPADAEHRFGHGKAEGLAALLQSLIVVGSGLFVGFKAIQRLTSPQPLTEPAAGIAVMVVATLATLALVLFQHRVAHRTGSVAIHADSMHYRADIFLNIGVGLAIALTAWTGWAPADPLVGLLVAAYIIYEAFGILRNSLKILLDHEIPESERSNVKKIALAHPDVLGLHDMKTRFGGNNYIIQFHLELEPQITLLRSHRILDEVEDRIRDHYPDCEIIIHPDPLGVPERREYYK